LVKRFKNQSEKHLKQANQALRGNFFGEQGLFERRKGGDGGGGGGRGREENGVTGRSGAEANENKKPGSWDKMLERPGWANTHLEYCQYVCRGQIKLKRKKKEVWTNVRKNVGPHPCFSEQGGGSTRQGLAFRCGKSKEGYQEPEKFGFFFGWGVGVCWPSKFRGRLTLPPRKG